MRDIIKLSAELQARMNEEMTTLVNDRTAARSILEARARELELRRDEEFKRIEKWAADQKAMVGDIFGALLAETKADFDRNEALIVRIGGEAQPPSRATPAATVRVLNKAAAAFARAAE